MYVRDCLFDTVVITTLVLHLASISPYRYRSSPFARSKHVVARDVRDASMRSIPAERRIEWQSLPAVRILTEPHGMPGKLSLSYSFYRYLWCCKHNNPVCTNFLPFTDCLHMLMTCLAAQDGHLPSVYTYPGEFMENSVRALRGFSNSRKLIYTRFYLPSAGADDAGSSQVHHICCQSSVWQAKHCQPLPHLPCYAKLHKLQSVFSD